MKKKKQEASSHENQIQAYCYFCGATIGQISERTENIVNTIFYCKKCIANYCDQCSYEKEKDGNLVQFSLRCEKQIEMLEMDGPAFCVLR